MVVSCLVFSGLVFKGAPSLCRFVVCTGCFQSLFLRERTLCADLSFSPVVSISAPVFLASDLREEKTPTCILYVCLRGGTCETYHPPHVSKCRTRQPALCAAMVLCVCFHDFQESHNSPLVQARYEYLACSPFEKLCTLSHGTYRPCLRCAFSVVSIGRPRLPGAVGHTVPSALALHAERKWHYSGKRDVGRRRRRSTAQACACILVSCNRPPVRKRLLK